MKKRPRNYLGLADIITNSIVNILSDISFYVFLIDTSSRKNNWFLSSSIVKVDLCRFHDN